ncbi:acyl carrier protein [Actinomycetes bacterium M1A6_2h]
MTQDTIRDVLRAHAKLGVDVDTIEASDDLYSLGLTSHASVTVMLALEDAFDIEFPDSLLKKGTFESIESIESALNQLSST